MGPAREAPFLCGRGEVAFGDSRGHFAIGSRCRVIMKNIVLQEIDSRRNHNISLPCVIGRSNQADLVFQDATVSQRHALISEKNNQIWIEDLQSSNGVYLNEERITEKAVLKSGDSIQLGQIGLVVSGAEEEAWEQTIVLHSFEPKAESKLDREKLELIHEIAAELSENQDIKALGEKIFSRFSEIFKQDRSYLALFQEDGSLKPLFSCPYSEFAPISKSIINRLFRSGESFLLEDALSETSLKAQESVIGLRIRSALCVPLIYHNQIYGVIYLDRNIPRAYKQDDLELLGTIASILAPLIENARLWSELKRHYANAMESLKETQARLINLERKAAYVRLAQAMAHEIRNPLMVIGGLLRRVAQSEPKSSTGAEFQAILSSVERVEMVLKEVDDFVKIPFPEKKLVRVDHLVQEEIESRRAEWQESCLSPFIFVSTQHVMVPLDSALFKKALSMVFKEIALSIPQGSDFKISIQDSDNELEILFGEIDRDRRLCEPFDPALHEKPWSLSLFLNIAHKILSDHGGKLLLDPLAHSALPIIMRVPRTIKAEYEAITT